LDFGGVSAAVLTDEDDIFAVFTGNATPAIQIDETSLVGASDVTQFLMSIVTFALMEEGALTLNSTVSEFVNVSGFANVAGDITVRELLSHTSGLDEFSDDDNYLSTVLFDVTRAFTADELINEFVGEAGERGTFDYANTNFLILGLILESANGDETLAESLTRLVLTPADAASVGIYDTNEGDPQDLAPLFADVFGTGFPQQLTPNTAVFTGAGAAGNAYGTPADFLRIAEALFDGDILSEMRLEQMTEFVETTDRLSNEYALGVEQFDITLDGVEIPFFGHIGSINYGSVLLYSPDAEAGVFLSTNNATVSEQAVLDLAISLLDAAIDGTEVEVEEELPATVVDIIVESEIHTTLEAAVIAAELADDLSGEGPFTVFAPTDEAFAALPEGTVEALLEDPTGDLAQILLYHVVSGKVLSTDLMDGLVVETLNGQTVEVTINDSGIFINDAQVTVADLEAENGVVHVINAVLLPELEEELPETVFDIIADSEIHTTLEAAIIAAELDDDLSSEGPFTVFAPTDEAFEALPEGVVETLLEDPTGDLAQILLYHVVGDTISSTRLKELRGQDAEIETLNGQSVTVRINSDNIFIDDAEIIIRSDIRAENGLVHVINAVLLPELEEVDCDDVVDGGTVALADGSTETTIIIDEEADVLTFMAMDTLAPNFTYVITDDQNNILGLPEGNTAELNGAGTGICRVWGLAYTGNITAMLGDNAAEVDLTDACFDLSDNFITVTRNEPDTGDTFLEVRPEARFVGQEAGELVFVINSNTDWSIDVDTDWVEFFGGNGSSNTGSGTRFVKVLYLENADMNTRTATFTVRTTTGLTETFELTQGGTGDFIFFSEEEIEVSAPSDRVEVDLVANADWTVTSDADWVRASQASGNNNSTITLVVDANSSTTARTATLTATTISGETATITVTQAGAPDVDVFFELRPESLTVSSAAGEAQFIIFTNTDWRVETDADWVEFFSERGTETGFIKVFYEENVTGAARVAEFDVFTPDGLAGTFTLTQEAAGNNAAPNTVFGRSTATITDVAIAPNPAADWARVQFDVTTTTTATIRLFDGTGRQVRTLFRGILDAGQQNIEVEVADLPAGSYYLQVLTGEMVHAQPFLISRR
jgi:uncharacterized surface protein with fasciclin (FAS1) repeats